MNDNIVRLESIPMVLFAKIDADPGFSIKLCNEASLFQAVQEALFFELVSSKLTGEQLQEIQDTVEQLKEGGDVAFEDGWMSLRAGMAAVTDFLMQKIKEAKEEERYADGERYKELVRREEAETRFAVLRTALCDALGDRALEIAAKAGARPGGQTLVQH